MSRRTRRRNERRRTEQASPSPLDSGQPGGDQPALETDPTTLALKLMLAHLQDDGTGRVMHVLGYLIPLFDAREWGTVAGTIGYLLEQTTGALERGYGGRAAAIDELTKVLAVKVLARNPEGDR